MFFLELVPCYSLTLLVLQDSGPYCDWLAVGGGGALCWHWLLLLLLQHQAQRKEKGNLTKRYNASEHVLKADGGVAARNHLNLLDNLHTICILANYDRVSRPCAARTRLL
jgi:hypothetical protein